MNFEKTPITRDNIIDIVNRWLDYHQSKYIVTIGIQTYVSGGCQTDLRAFITKCLADDMDKYDAMELAKTVK